MRTVVATLGLLLLMQQNALATDPLVIEADANPERFGWDGAYVGISAGYGWLRDIDYSFAPPVRDKGDDWNVGLYGGYLFGLGNFVLGGEIEATRLDIDFETFNFITVGHSVEIKARAGYAFDRLLLSVDGGAAYAATNFMGLKGWGWAAGAGIDYAMTDNILVGLHYSHLQFDKFDTSLIDAQIDTLKMRVGYKF